ncbi:glycosyltransferase family 15 protein [Xylariaceae sp. AK1471]|nr:glycosyltransferase family 15 protein [Xylariaceae sp. AK1471]
MLHHRLLQRLQRLRRRGLHKSPILWLILVAALIEAVSHSSQFRVPVPNRELDTPFYGTCQEPDVDGPRENAAIVMLARNEEVDKARRSVESLERRFNQWFKYPIVFLNDEPWSETFIQTLNATTSAETAFEYVPKKEWLFPQWMNHDSARASIKRQGDRGVLYAGKETYHHMCRFFSGYFYQVEALKKYKWYWRLEPDVEFSCSITYDPFREMARHKKVYGFTLALWEEKRTCPSLFRKVSDWKESQNIPSTSLWNAGIDPSWVPWPFRSWMRWFSHRDRHGDGWNLCHYWSNFEIADLDFFRGEKYQSLFQKLERDGGFYSERWGDAAVHSLAVNMLAEPHQVHHFADIGYRHDWYYQCPANAPGGQLPESKMLNRVEETWAPEIDGGVGCRCDCDGRTNRNTASYCHNKLRAPNTIKRPWSTWLLGWIF